MPKEATLYKVVDSEKKIVECIACPRRCKVGDGLYGFCGIRWNFGGKLYLVSYGLAIAVAVDPIEKKPLYHFYPGSMVFSMSTTGCSWGCFFCQNWDISQRRIIAGWRLPPEMAVNIALAYGVQGITYTYNEPTVFIEYAHDVGVLAKKHNLFNTMVTNGYMTDEAIDLAVKFIDAASVDLKGHGNPELAKKLCLVPNIEEVFSAVLELKRKKVFVEITDLVIPRYGDSIDEARRLARWIVENLGPETPVHFLRFHPDYKLVDVPSTPVKVLEKHVEVAKDEGLVHVYIGNVPGHAYEHTYCPGCGNPVIRRMGFDIIEHNVTEDLRCKFCGYRLNIVGGISPTYKMDRFVYIPLEMYTEFLHVPFDKIKDFVLGSGV
uniref:AmmeMemoRadiSam system radical SAM enzyme n=1 Tax=Ignisphaera aggregans TaxID=334771 RepID=A0A7C2V990_9CREN